MGGFRVFPFDESVSPCLRSAPNEPEWHPGRAPNTNTYVSANPALRLRNGSQLGRSHQTSMSKSIPCGLLTLAALAPLAVAQEAAGGGGWTAKPGSGLTYDGGDAFGLKWTNRIQVLWTFANNEDAPDNNTFDVRRLRTTFEGHAFSRNILYFINLDATDSGPAGDGAIKDGWVQWNFSSSDTGSIGLRMGQGKTQYGLEATGSSAGLWFVERSSAARAFSEERSTGVWLNGVMMENKFRWSAGAMNGDTAGGLGAGYTDVGEEAANSDNELSYVLAANFDPLGDFFGGKQTKEKWRQGDWRTDDKSWKGTVGAGIALGNGKDTAGNQDVESTSFNVNTAWTGSNINVLAEFFMRTDDQQDVTPSNEEEPSGFNLAVGYLMDKSGDSPMQWGFGLRFCEVETDAGASGGVDYLDGAQGIGGAEGSVREISLVLNAFYHGHSCKTQVELTHQDVDFDVGTDVSNILARIGFQLEI